MNRVRVQGDLWHGRVPEGAVYVGRAAPGLKASPYCNPFKVKEHGAEALQLYAQHLAARPELLDAARRDLAGLDLACWCRLDEPCHADVLLRLVAGGRTEVERAQTHQDVRRYLSARVWPIYMTWREVPRDKVVAYLLESVRWWQRHGRADMVAQYARDAASVAFVTEDSSL